MQKLWTIIWISLHYNLSAMWGVQMIITKVELDSDTTSAPWAFTDQTDKNQDLCKNCDGAGMFDTFDNVTGEATGGVNCVECNGLGTA